MACPSGHHIYCSPAKAFTVRPNGYLKSGHFVDHMKSTCNVLTPFQWAHDKQLENGQFETDFKTMRGKNQTCQTLSIYFLIFILFP